MEIDKMFESMKGEFKNFKDFLKHLERVKTLKQDIRLLKRSLHEREVQVKTNSLNEKIESSKHKVTQRAEHSKKLQELEKQAASMRQEVNRLKNLKINRDVEIKLLNTKLELKQNETKIQAEQVKTILSLKSTMTRTTNYKKEELWALIKDIENREIEKVKFSVKSAEQQMTLDDLISFISSMISYNQRKTADNRRDMRFLYNKLEPDVRGKLDLGDL